MVSVSIQLNKNAGNPLHEQISDALEKAIKAGALRGTRLPSVRGLARRLKVSPSTVTAAYRTLVDKHLAKAAPRSSFVVAADTKTREAPGILSMEKIQPNLKYHPVAEFGQLIAEVAGRDESAGGYEDYRGWRRLRELLAAMNAEAGIAADPDMDIFITAGCQQAIALVAQIMGPGAKVAVEDPTYPGAQLAFQQAGATLVAIPNGDDGPDLKALEAAAGSIDLFYCCPTYGNPTGRSWSIKTREWVAALAAWKGFTIFEDDYLGDLDYLDEKLPRLKALAPEAKIIHVRTFSKCLLPALRIAGVTADPQTIDLLLKKRLAADITGSPFLQRALALFIERGGYKDHLARVRPFYQSVRQALRQELDKEGSAIRYGDPQGGLSLLAELPKGLDAGRFAAECENLGVLIAPARDYFLNPRQKDAFFRMCFGGIEPADAPFVVSALNRACERTALAAQSAPLV
ncbi:MAG: PLP-dependent aminotransferase family protein [Deltaproteobacteria bacterium]|nr:PLP-dependent aminotransferase family protein [Deltaproteobacteria bacterium]